MTHDSVSVGHSQHTNEDVVVRLQRENAALRELAEKQQAALKRLRTQRETEIRKTLVCVRQSREGKGSQGWRQ